MDRIVEEWCGCRYDTVTGIRTHHCGRHLHEGTYHVLAPQVNNIIEHLAVSHDFNRSKLDELFSAVGLASFRVTCEELHRWDHEIMTYKDNSDDQ